MVACDLCNDLEYQGGRLSLSSRSQRGDGVHLEHLAASARRGCPSCALLKDVVARYMPKDYPRSDIRVGTDYEDRAPNSRLRLTVFDDNLELLIEVFTLPGKSRTGSIHLDNNMVFPSTWR